MDSDFRCPITKNIFYDPVIGSDGQTYERQAIEEWLKKNQTSPISRKPMDGSLHTSLLVKNMITKMLDINPKLKKEQYVPMLSPNKIVTLISNNSIDLKK